MMPCGECTLCCKLLETHDEKTASPIGIYCKHCDHNKGCTIYKDRPEECRIYQCMWTQMENVGEELRPDKCGVIFDRISDDVISARIEKGLKLNKLVVKQIESFNREGFSVLIFREQNSKCFLAKTHSEEYVRGIVDGHAKLHRRLD